LVDKTRYTLLYSKLLASLSGGMPQTFPPFFGEAIFTLDSFGQGK
jgi:hypothetical protein